MPISRHDFRPVYVGPQLRCAESKNPKTPRPKNRLQGFLVRPADSWGAGFPMGKRHLKKPFAESNLKWIWRGRIWWGKISLDGETALEKMRSSGWAVLRKFLDFLTRFFVRYLWYHNSRIKNRVKKSIFFGKKTRKNRGKNVQKRPTTDCKKAGQKIDFF